MEKPFRWFLFVAAPTALMAGVIALVFGGDGGAAEAMRLFRRATPNLRVVVEAFTDYASILLYLAYAFLLVTAVKKRDKEAGRFVLRALAFLAVTLAAVYCLKVVVSRPRPFVDTDHEGWYSFNKKFHSFPSNHMSEVFALSLPFALRYRIPLFALLLGLYDAAAGFARLYLGSHYPTDILGSLVVGCLVGWVCQRVFFKYFK